MSTPICRVDKVQPARQVVFDMVEEWIEATQAGAVALGDEA